MQILTQEMINEECDINWVNIKLRKNFWLLELSVCLQNYQDYVWQEIHE